MLLHKLDPKARSYYILHPGGKDLKRKVKRCVGVFAKTIKYLRVGICVKTKISVQNGLKSPLLLGKNVSSCVHLYICFILNICRQSSTAPPHPYEQGPSMASDCPNYNKGGLCGQFLHSCPISAPFSGIHM